MDQPPKCEGKPLGSYYHEFKGLRLYGKRGFDARMQVTECRKCGVVVYRAPGPGSGRLKRRGK